MKKCKKTKDVHNLRDPRLVKAAGLLASSSIKIVSHVGRRPGEDEEALAVCVCFSASCSASGATFLWRRATPCAGLADACSPEKCGSRFVFFALSLVGLAGRCVARPPPPRSVLCGSQWTWLRCRCLSTQHSERRPPPRRQRRVPAPTVTELLRAGSSS